MIRVTQQRANTLLQLYEKHKDKEFTIHSSKDSAYMSQLKKFGMAERVGTEGRNAIWRLAYTPDMIEVVELSKLFEKKKPQKKENIERNHIFTPEEDEYIRNHWGRVSRTKIARRIKGALKWEVNQRAIELGVARKFELEEAQ